MDLENIWTIVMLCRETLYVTYFLLECKYTKNISYKRKFFIIVSYVIPPRTKRIFKKYLWCILFCPYEV